jgi:hypothetical protein
VKVQQVSGGCQKSEIIADKRLSLLTLNFCFTLAGISKKDKGFSEK